MNTKPEFIVREDLQQVGVNLLPLLLKGLEDVLRGARGARVSSVIGYGTVFEQPVVVAPNGVFHDGGKGGGLIGAFTVLLNR